MTLLKPLKLKTALFTVILGLSFASFNTEALAQPVAKQPTVKQSITHKKSSKKKTVRSTSKKKTVHSTSKKKPQKAATAAKKKSSKKKIKTSSRSRRSRTSHHISKKHKKTPSLLSPSFIKNHVPQLEIDPQFSPKPFTPSADVKLSELTSIYAKKGSFNKEEIQNILAKEALSYLGIRYKYGGTSPKHGFDCSGLIYYIAQNNHISIPRTAAGLATQGEKISKQNLKEGDLVFFNTSGRRYSHVGIYLGNGKFVHAPRKGRTVSVSSLDNAYWRKHYTGARRISQFK